jgi:hypothetical protein
MPEPLLELFVSAAVSALILTNGDIIANLSGWEI